MYPYHINVPKHRFKFFKLRMCSANNETRSVVEWMQHGNYTDNCRYSTDNSRCD
jgi:hypothetical protein